MKHKHQIILRSKGARSRQHRKQRRQETERLKASEPKPFRFRLSRKSKQHKKSLPFILHSDKTLQEPFNGLAL